MLCTVASIPHSCEQPSSTHLCEEHEELRLCDQAVPIRLEVPEDAAQFRLPQGAPAMPLCEVLKALERNLACPVLWGVIGISLPRWEEMGILDVWGGHQ